jgi:Fe-S-cluster containining protein
VVFHIEEMHKPAGQKCEHLCAHGCSRYADRPATCRAYRCAWLDGYGEDDLRPDRSGIVYDLRDRHDGRGKYIMVMEARIGALQEEHVKRAIDELAASGVPVVLTKPSGAVEVLGKKGVLDRLRILSAGRM